MAPGSEWHHSSQCCVALFLPTQARARVMDWLAWHGILFTMLRLVFIDHCAWRRYVGFFRAWFCDSLLHRERGRLYLGSCSFRHVDYHFDLEPWLAIEWFKSVAMTTMNPTNRYFCSFLLVPCNSFGFLVCIESMARILGWGFRSWPQQAGNLQWHILQQFLGAKGFFEACTYTPRLQLIRNGMLKGAGMVLRIAEIVWENCAENATCGGYLGTIVG